MWCCVWKLQYPYVFRGALLGQGEWQGELVIVSGRRMGLEAQEFSHGGISKKTYEITFLMHAGWEDMLHLCPIGSPINYFNLSYTGSICIMSATFFPLLHEYGGCVVGADFPFSL